MTSFIHFLFQDKKIRFWDTRTSSTEPLTEIEMTGKVTSLDLSRNGIHLLSCVRDDTLRLIDLRSVIVVNSNKTFVSSHFSLGGCLFFTNPTCLPQGTQGSFPTYQTLENNSTLPCYSKKLADLENICVWNYEKGPWVIRLDLQSNTYILDDYDDN